MTEPDVTFPLDQYQALRFGCGLVELAKWSSVTVAGNDRLSFLNNFCTNELKPLASGDNCETFVLNVKGKVLGHGLVTCRDDELVVVTVPEQAASLIAHLDRYVIREDVQLTDTTAERAYLVVSGHQALDALAAVDPTLTDSDSWNRRTANFAATHAGIDIRMIAWHWLVRPPNPPAGLVEVKPAELLTLQQALQAHSAVICDLPAFEAMRIESGLPLYGVDFDADHLPQEIGRNDQAISFTKGCYLGQETVARIDALGHVNRQLAGVRFDSTSIPPVGTKLQASGTDIGQVTSATYSPRLGSPLAIAMIRRGFGSPGQSVESAAGPGQVVSLPVEATNDEPGIG